VIDLRATYSAEQFAELIERETDSIELKTGTSQDKLQAAFVALSNGDGGYIFIGETRLTTLTIGSRSI